MTSKPVAQLLVDLGGAGSHSRPHVSNDNPYSEAAFKTLKYAPVFPERFGSLADAGAFAEQFSARGPFDRNGRTLRQFDLKRRLFRHPCSYLIHSDAFDALPTPVKGAARRLPPGTRRRTTRRIPTSRQRGSVPRAPA